MAKDNSAEDDFLGELAVNNEADPLENQGLEDIFPEEEVTEQPKEVEEKTPSFHKLKDDPKFQRFLDKEIKRRMPEVKTSAQETFKQEVSAGDPDLVKAFEQILGNDTPEKVAALKALENSLAKVDERATAKALERLQQVKEQEEEREERELEEARNEIEEGFEDIENYYGIELTDRQKQAYKEFLLKVEPKGGYQEYPDFVETFGIFKTTLNHSVLQMHKLKLSLHEEWSVPQPAHRQLEYREMVLNHFGTQ